MLTLFRSGSGRKAVLWLGAPLVWAAAAAALLTMTANAASGGFIPSLLGSSAPKCSTVTAATAVSQCQRPSAKAAREHLTVTPPVTRTKPLHHLVLPAPYGVSPVIPGVTPHVQLQK